MLTKINYEKIAEIINKSQGLSLSSLAIKLCDYFYKDNKNFERFKFLKASGVTPEGNATYYN